MTRKKVTLAYIANDSARKATFKKRKKGLMKKVSELSTLCGIEACAVIYSPYDTEPEVWPSTIGARRAIARFRNMSEMDQSKRMVNQPTFLRQRIGKAEEQLKKQQRDNREKEVTQVMYRALTGPGLNLQGLSLLDLNDLGWVVEKTIKEIDEKIKQLQKNPVPSQQPQHNNISNNHVSGQSSYQSCIANTDRAKNENNNNHNHNDAIIDVGNQNKGLVQSEEDMKGVNSGLEVGMDGMQNQQWYIELLKPSTEGLTGFSRFSNISLNNNNSSSSSHNNNNNNTDMVLPPALPYPYTNAQNNAGPWSNFFLS